MRPAIILAGALAACTTTLPESNPDLAVANGTGVGFTSYDAYEEAQARAARPAPVVPPPVVSPEYVAPQPVLAAPTVRGAGGLDPAIVAAVEATGAPQGLPAPGASAAATIGLPPQSPVEIQPTIAQTPQIPLYQPPVAQSPALQPAMPQPGAARAPAAPGISDEQDFDAVSERETIESDAARLERLRLERTVVEPTALPTDVRTGPNIVEYALRTTNAVGQPVWRRTTVFAQNKYDKNCAAYATPDRAQEAFLAMGGPSRDKKGLDPDGDGFACDWSPAPFRAAVGR